MASSLSLAGSLLEDGAVTDITPSDTQARAIAAIKDWFENRTHENQVYRLFGYAGSGKSSAASLARTTSTARSLIRCASAASNGTSSQ